MAPGAPACVLRCMDGAARARSHIPRGGATLPWGGAVVNQLLLQHGRHGQGVHYCWRSQQDNRRKPRQKPETSRTAIRNRTPRPRLPCASQECRYATFQAGTQHQCEPPTHPSSSSSSTGLGCLKRWVTAGPLQGRGFALQSSARQVPCPSAQRACRDMFSFS